LDWIKKNYITGRGVRDGKKERKKEIWEGGKEVFMVGIGTRTTSK
jgi:hypothetical protein